MDTTNQDRRKHHSHEEYSDEDFYSDEDCHDRPNQMCQMCPCMQGMYMNPGMMSQQQMQQPMMGQMGYSDGRDDYDDEDDTRDGHKHYYKHGYYPYMYNPYFYGGHPHYHYHR